MAHEEKSYNLIEVEKGVPIKAWTKGVPLEDQARAQLRNVAELPFVCKCVAAMPDVHWGIGATVGSVIPTKGAIIPAAVGVDMGCGMMAVETDLNARDLPDNLKRIRTAFSMAVRMRFKLSGRSRAFKSVSTAIMPQPMSTPTAAGMIAPLVGITLPTVAPIPQCTSGIAATHLQT